MPARQGSSNPEVYTCDNPDCRGDCPRAGDNATTCTALACRRWLRELNAAARAEGCGTKRKPRKEPARTFVDVLPAACRQDSFQMWDIKELYGAAYCRRRDLNPYDLANGRDTYHEEVALLVRGKVGEDAADDRGSSTRWIRLQELVDNCDGQIDETIEELDALKEFIQEAAEALREAKRAAA